MTAKNHLSPLAVISNVLPKRDACNCRKSSKTLSSFWPFRRGPKMYQSESSIAPAFNLYPQEEKNNTRSVPTSPVLCPKKPIENRYKSEEKSAYLSSSCSSGYSSGYSSGDSETIETDRPMSEVSTTEIGSTGFILHPTINNNIMILKKRNSKENLKNFSSLPTGNFYSSGHSDCVMNKNYFHAVTVTPKSNINLNSNTSSSNTLKDLSVSQPTDFHNKSSKRLSSTLVSSNSSSEISNEESPRRRVMDDEGFIRRAACVCVNEDETKVVLISSKNSGGGWLVPGGGLEDGEEETDAAAREAWEEAGITGDITRRLGIFEIKDAETNKRKRTAVYVLKVQEQHSSFPEAYLGRVREWYSIDAAISHLSQCKPHQIAYLKAL